MRLTVGAATHHAPRLLEDVNVKAYAPRPTEMIPAQNKEMVRASPPAFRGDSSELMANVVVVSC